MSRRIRIVGIGCLLLISMLQANALSAVIEYAGKVNDAGPWGAAFLGTDGYDLYATSLPGEPTSTGGVPFGPVRLTLLPSYVSSISAAGANSYYRSNSYQQLINPQTGTIVHAGLTYNFSPSNQEKGLLSLAIGPNPPPVFYVGYLTDTGDGAWDYPDALRFRQTSGSGAGNSGLVITDQDANFGVDFFFFKVSQAAPGDVITISGYETQCGVNWCNLTAAGLVFTQIPEPASGLFLCLGLAGFIMRSRRGR
ncbi:hypothetical protein RAS2_11980 [Phycisphaerae bacterium RAS2]|nr:hypothetical protein RAS2_11980 [Phycisphaerae bacterium RAS2]